MHDSDSGIGIDSGNDSILCWNRNRNQNRSWNQTFELTWNRNLIYPIDFYCMDKNDASLFMDKNDASLFMDKNDAS